MGKLLIVPLIRSSDVARAQRPSVRKREEPLESLDIRYDALSVHCVFIPKKALLGQLLF